MGRWILLVAGLLSAAGVAFAIWERALPTQTSEPGQEADDEPIAPAGMSASELLRLEIATDAVAAPGMALPLGMPLRVALPVSNGSAVSLEQIMRTDPLQFLEMCLDRCEREVHSYTCLFLKRERVDGVLYPPKGFEKIKVGFREDPFSVQMVWVEHAKLAQKVIYVRGENDNKMLARPAGLLGAFVVSRDVDGPDAKQSGRYTIDQMGMHLALKRAVASMKKAQENGTLHLRYDGLVKLHETGDRPCYKFVRTPYEPPEEDGLNELTLYIDRELWLQTGSVLRDSARRLLGEYFFRDIQINPTFPAGTFTRKAL